ncbi:MAG: MFS transporter [Anaerolineales bacterium]|nr:MFS transporter [Anaerolineales bacterium]
MTPRPTPYRFVIAGLILAAHLSLGLNVFPISPLLPVIIEDYGITRASASLLVALPVLAKAFIGLPGSVIVDRFGLKRIFTLSWFMVGALALSSVAPNFLTMLLLRLVYGVGAGFMVPGTGPLVMQWFRPREIPIINSLYLVVMSLGIAISVSIAAPLANVIAWQSVLGLFGGIALLGAVAWSLLGQTQPDKQQAKSGFAFGDIWSVLRDRTIFLLVVGDALVFIQYGALTSWLPTYFHEFRGMSLDQAGYVTGLLPFVGIFAILAGGFLTPKIKSKRLFFIVPGILVGLGGFGSFLIGNTAVICVSVIMLGIGTWIYQPMLLTLPMQLPWMTPKKIAVVRGTSVTVTGLGVFISPIVVGASRDIFGTFVPGFFIWAVLAWALLIAGILLPRSGTADHV